MHRTAPPPTALHRAGSGSPMVLLHGFTDTWRTWRAVLPELQAHHDVLAPTLPGHHGGEAFGTDIGMSIEATADVVERAMDDAGFERAHLVGNSLGGWLALELACRGRASSVLALCPAGGWEHASRESRAVLGYFRRTHALLQRTTPGMARFVASRPRLRALAFRDVMARPQRLPPARAAEMIEGAQNCAIMLDAIAMGERPGAFSDLGELNCPVTIAYGSRDRIIRWPTHYGRMRRLLPDAEWVELEGLGHLPQWDDPPQVAALALRSASRAEAQPVAPSSKMQPE